MIQITGVARNMTISKIGRSAIVAFLARVAQSLGGLIINASLARILAPTDYGRYFIVLSVSSLLTTFVLMGANIEMLKIAASKGRVVAFWAIPKLAKTVVLISIFVYFVYLSPFCTTIEARVGLVLPPQLKILVVPLSFCLAMQSILYDYYRGTDRLACASLVANYGALGSIGYGVISISFFAIVLSIMRKLKFKLGLYELITIATVLSLLIVVFVISSEYKLVAVESSPLSEPKYQFVSNIKSRVLLLYTAILAILINQMDLYVVAKAMSKTYVGLYGAAQRLTLIVLLPLMIVTTFFQPMSAKLFSQRKFSELSDISRGVTTILLLMGGSICVVFVTSGAWIMSTVYGESFAKASSVLVIKTIGAIALLCSGLANAVFTTTGNEKVLVYVGGGGVAIFYAIVSIFQPATMEQIAFIHSCVMAAMSVMYGIYSKLAVGIDIMPSHNLIWTCKTLYRVFLGPDSKATRNK